MYYEIQNLSVTKIKEAKESIQKAITYSQNDLLARDRNILSNGKGEIKHVFFIFIIGFVGEILLQKNSKIPIFDKNFEPYLKRIRLLALNYLAMAICETVEEDIYYDNLKMIFHDPSDITENSFTESSNEEVIYHELNGLYVLENQMFGICFVEQLYLRVILCVKTNMDGRILEIVSMYPSILGA
ncbi:MAG: hypothetical protein PHS59_18170 [Paludibacter sp.]|nr:hypothetical protein [Paludibacter sp.]